MQNPAPGAPLSLADSLEVAPGDLGVAPPLPKKLAESLGVSSESKITYQEACTVCAAIPGGTTQLSLPVVYETPVGPNTYLDLPVAMVNMDSKIKVKHLFEVIENVEPQSYDWDKVKGYMLQNRYDQLPSPFQPAGPCAAEFKMQLVIVDSQVSETPKRCVLKHYVFSDMIPLEYLKILVHGQPMVIQWGQQKRVGPKAFQYMLCKVGGQHARYFSFQESKPPPSLSQ